MGRRLCRDVDAPVTNGTSLIGRTGDLRLVVVGVLETRPAGFRRRERVEWRSPAPDAESDRAAVLGAAVRVREGAGCHVDREGLRAVSTTIRIQNGLR